MRKNDVVNVSGIDVDIEKLTKLLSAKIGQLYDKYLYAVEEIRGVWLTDDKDVYIVEFIGNNHSKNTIPVTITNQNGNVSLNVDKKQFDDRFIDNFYDNAEYIDMKRSQIYARQVQEPKIIRKQKQNTVQDFKLTQSASKHFKYDAPQKRLLSDLVKWLKSGGDVENYDNDAVKFHGLNGSELGIPEQYKNDPIHAGDMSKLIKLVERSYGTSPEGGKLYRGVSEAELQSIMRSISSGKTKFRRNTQTSFTSDYAHAEKFAKYGGGSSIEAKMDRKAGKVITLLTNNKKLFNLDEFLFYYYMAYDIAGVFEMSQKDAVDNTMLEHEWLVSKDHIWKLVDKDTLTFTLS